VPLSSSPRHKLLSSGLFISHAWRVFFELSSRLINNLLSRTI
jgi:hypothetical protein